MIRIENWRKTMRYRVFHRWILVALCVLSVGLLEWPARTRAQSLGGITGTVNQTVAIPGGQVVINEQQVLSDGTLVVNALHATVSGVADAVVASATAGPSGGNASAVKATTY